LVGAVGCSNLWGFRDLAATDAGEDIVDSDAGTGVDANTPKPIADAPTRGDDAGAEPDAGEREAGPVGPCDGGQVYDHQVGVDGYTWLDCVPPGTYDATEALAACLAFAKQESSPSCEPSVTCLQANSTCPGTVEWSCSNDNAAPVFWAYAGPGVGHLSSECPSATSGGTWN
jgi:hypothetical protein